MPLRARKKPARLAEKLLRIRTALGLSQNELIRLLDLGVEIQQGSISGYELGTRLPPLDILLRYSRVAGVCTDVLIDDELELPQRLPGKPKHRAF